MFICPNVFIPKIRFGYILEGLGTGNVGINIFKGIWHLLWSFGKF
jgi:hypothetical protein